MDGFSHMLNHQRVVFTEGCSVIAAQDSEPGRGACAHHRGTLEMCRPEVATSRPFSLTTAEWLPPTRRTRRKPQVTNWGTRGTQAGYLLSNITALQSQQDLLMIFNFCVCVCVFWILETIQTAYLEYMVSINRCYVSLKNMCVFFKLLLTWMAVRKSDSHPSSQKKGTISVLRHACICGTQSKKVSGDRVNLQTINAQEETSCTTWLCLLQFRASVDRCGTRWCKMESSLLWCCLWLWRCRQQPSGWLSILNTDLICTVPNTLVFTLIK